MQSITDSYIVSDYCPLDEWNRTEWSRVSREGEWEAKRNAHGQLLGFHCMPTLYRFVFRVVLRVKLFLMPIHSIVMLDRVQKGGEGGTEGFAALEVFGQLVTWSGDEQSPVSLSCVACSMEESVRL